MNALRLAKNVRSLQRLRHIAAVLTQHGFGHVVDRMHLRRFSPLRRWRPPPASEQLEPMNIGRRLATVCNELGPTFIKLGQVATTRPDLLPAEVLAELKTLQDRVTPFDTGTARRLIEEELGAPADVLFRFLGEEPIATGSIGQVYRAVTPDGTKVVVKVKRPDIDRIVRLDLHLLKMLAETMENLLPESRVYRPVMLIDEFEQALTRELDFTHEGSSTMRLHEAFADLPHVRIPKTHWALSTSRVLTLDELSGENVGRVLESDAREFDRQALAARLADLYVKQFFEVGTFHTDPHPGNILVVAPGEIGLIDFGQTGIVSDELASQLVAMITAAIYRDIDFVVGVLAEMNALGPKTDARHLVRDLRILEDKYYGLPLGRVDLVGVFHEVTALMRRHDVAMPRDLVLVLKTLSTVMGIVMQLDPQFDLVALLRPRLADLIRDRFSPGQLARALGAATWHGAGLLRDFPRQMRSALRHFAEGQWRLNVHHEHLDRLIDELDRTGNHLSFSIVIAAIIVGSSLVVTAETSMEPLGVPLGWFGVIGYMCAGLLGLVLLWTIIRGRRR
jgi:ubiquinone biosynthesis protein